MVPRIVKAVYNYDSYYVLDSCDVQIGFTFLLEHHHCKRKLFMLKSIAIINEQYPVYFEMKQITILCQLLLNILFYNYTCNNIKNMCKII